MRLIGQAVEHPLHDHEEHGNEEDTEKSTGHHAAEHAGADGALGAGAGAGRHRQRQHTQTERQRSHQDRAQAIAHGMHGRLDHVHAVLDIFLGEFHDQDGVLAGQADGGKHRHLEVNVALQAPHGGGQHGADHAERHGQQDRGRNGPALVQGREAQEHDDDRERIQQRRLGARGALLVGLPGPVDRVARRQPARPASGPPSSRCRN